MENYYYSKFEKKNWRWWNTAGPSAEIPATLSAISRYVKVYKSAKYLFALFAAEGLILYSHREQIDRDEDGRSFSFQHFQIHKATTADDIKLKGYVKQFNEPEHYSNPELSAAEPPKPHYDHKLSTEKLFTSIWRSMFSGERICILNSNTHLRAFSKAEIDQLNFLSFPGGRQLIEVLDLLPFELIRYNSILLNYENGMLSNAQGLAENIKIIFCYQETVTDPESTSEKLIDENRLKREGYDVVDPEKIMVSRSEEAFFMYMKDQFWSKDQELERLACVLILKQRPFENAAAGARFVYLTFKVTQRIAVEEGDFTAIDIYFRALEPLHDSAGSIKAFKEKLLPWLLDELPTDLLFKHFYQILGYVRHDPSFLAEFEMLSIPANGPCLNVLEIINDPRFDRLSPQLVQNLLDHFTLLKVDWDSLKTLPILEAVRKLAQKGLVCSNLQSIWEQLSSFKVSEDLPYLNILYVATRNKTALREFLTRQYMSTREPNWLAEAVKHQIKLVFDANNFATATPVEKIRILKDFKKFNDILSNAAALRERILVSLIDSIGTMTTMDELLRVYSSIERYSNHAHLAPVETALSKRALEWLIHDIDRERSFDALLHGMQEDHLARSDFKSLFDNHLYEFLQEHYRNAGLTLGQLICLGTLLAFTEAEPYRQTRKLFRALDKHLIIDTDSKQQHGRAVKKLVQDLQWKKDHPPQLKTLLEEQRGLLSVKKKSARFILVIGLVVTLLGAYWVTNRLTANNSNGNHGDTTTIKLPDVIQILPDSTAMTIAVAEQFLNQVFFENRKPTTFGKFNEVRRSVGFIKLIFPRPDFSIASIRKLDTLPGNFWWNRFVNLHQDSLSFSIRFINKKDSLLSASNPDSLIIVK